MYPKRVHSSSQPNLKLSKTKIEMVIKNSRYVYCVEF